MAAHPKTVGVLSKFVPTWRGAIYGQNHALRFSNRKARPFVLSLAKHSMKVIAFFFCLCSCFLAAQHAAHGDLGTLEIRVKDHRDAIGPALNGMPQHVDQAFVKRQIPVGCYLGAYFRRWPFLARLISHLFPKPVSSPLAPVRTGRRSASLRRPASSPT